MSLCNICVSQECLFSVKLIISELYEINYLVQFCSYIVECNCPLAVLKPGVIF